MYHKDIQDRRSQYWCKCVEAKMMQPINPVSPSRREPKMSLGEVSPEDQRRLGGRVSVDSPRGDTPVSDIRRSVDIRVAMQQAANVQEQQEEAEREKAARAVMNSPDSWIRSAIPVLPRWMSVLCLILNIVLPGSG